MKCSSIEKLILRSLDHKLTEKENHCLGAHLENCLSCQKIKVEYQEIMTALKTMTFPDPKPYFWTNLKPLLNEKRTGFFPSWKENALKIAASSALIAVLAMTGFHFIQKERSFSILDDMSETEILLLQNLSPFQETDSIFEEKNSEQKNMRLIFSSLEENSKLRRYFP